MITLVLLLSMCGCQGNFGSVDLQAPIDIPEDGIIEKNTVGQIKEENAIGCFCGESNGFAYEWTIFGSDIPEAREINLLADIRENEAGELEISLHQEENFGFCALLSVYLNEKWDAMSATAFVSGKPAASVSITGGSKTILNLSVDGNQGDLLIRPDAPMEEQIQMQIPVQNTESADGTASQDDYLSDAKQSDSRVYSDGSQKGKDKYNTDPVPEGKPMPVEPENQTVNKEQAYTCTFSIECSTILNNLDMLDPEKLEMVPSGGVILSKTTVTFYDGESVYDVLQRVCKEKGIHMEAAWTPIYNSAYVEGIHNLYEFDCGALSGWMYKVNGWYPNYGSSRYQLKDGDVVEWRYTCDLGNDIGGGYAVGG